MLWPHQTQGIEDTLAAIARGERKILLTSPTGGGKTAIALALARSFLARGKKVVWYTNRQWLLEQTHDVLVHARMSHGVRAAGYDDERDFHFQLSSLQTEYSRCLQRKTWGLHDADLALVDEAHVNGGPTAAKILEAHYEQGAVYVGFTATPLNLAHLYEVLLTAGATSQLRACGALVPAHHYGPDEPDVRKLRGLREGHDWTEGQTKQAMMRPNLWGRIWEWYEKLNPEHKATILFAPGVAESVWLAEQFCQRGVRAAHIDGQEVWLDGKTYRSDPQAREDLLEQSRDGRIKVVCNRFVLREGIDAPWLCHCIFATIFGSLQSFLQAGGRVLRAHPGVDYVTIQDHGGNWHRHGSLNADRQWSLTDTDPIVTGLRADGLRANPERQPWRCPQCGRIVSFYRCPCGYEIRGQQKRRPVVTVEGELVELTGDIYKPRRLDARPNGPALWERMYWRSRTAKGQRTFREAAALFARENHWQWPDPAWPFMPTDPYDQWRPVDKVPFEKLTSGTTERLQRANARTEEDLYA
jgi:DNA repair protein RadD